MDQSDLDLLQTLPTSHLESVVKTRRIPLSPLAPNQEPSVGTPTSPSLSPETILELASHLFNPTAITALLQELGEFETTILRELVNCGGRANSRDLAFYLTCLGFLSPSKKIGPIVFDQPQTSLPNTPLQPPQFLSALPLGL